MGQDELVPLNHLKELYNGLIQPVIAGYGGQTFTLVGDGLRVEFSSTRRSAGE